MKDQHVKEWLDDGIWKFEWFTRNKFDSRWHYKYSSTVRRDGNLEVLDLCFISQGVVTSFTI